MKVVITVIRAWPSGAHCLREDLEEMASLEGPSTASGPGSKCCINKDREP